MTLSSLLSVCCNIFEEGMDFYIKYNKLACTKNLIIKLSTAILLLVEVEPLDCSREFDFSEIFIVLLVLYFDLYLRAMLEFCRICTRFKIKKEQNKKCFKTLGKRRRWKHFILRMQGLPLASDGAYDKHDA